MKKILLIVLVILSLFLVSCGKKVDDNKDSGDEPDIVDPNDPDEEDDKPKEPTEEEILNQARKILETMTLEQKVGQMFMVGFSGTTVNNNLINAINKYKFGNIIYMGTNVSDSSNVVNLSQNIQNLVINTTKIPAFISIDQEGGMVVRFTEQATHFIGAMGLTATNDSSNAYKIGRLSGQELRHFGINMNLSPSLDVNNNSDNPVIGIRSYSDNPSVVGVYGSQMIKGLTESNVIAVAKHFPGHGDTVVDSHYGLPSINHSIQRLNDVELKPFKMAIDNGIDAIMSAHIIFSEIDPSNPATLSSKVINDLLRKELGFNGIVMTDAMGMAAIDSNYGAEVAAVKAINAGIDILLYTESTTSSVGAYNGVLNAIKSGEIKESTIDESVLRILSKKIKMNLFNDYLPKNNLTTIDFNNNYSINMELIRNSITLNKGNIDFFDSEKSTYFLSTVNNRYPLEPGLVVNASNNTLSTLAVKYFNDLGNNQVEKETIEATLNNTRIQNIKNKAKNYEQIVVALENITATQITLVNELVSINSNLILVSLKNPYDIEKVKSVKNHICTYGYYTETVMSLFDLLNKKYKATGVMPLSLKS